MVAIQGSLNISTRRMNLQMAISRSKPDLRVNKLLRYLLLNILVYNKAAYYYHLDENFISFLELIQSF